MERSREKVIKLGLNALSVVPQQDCIAVGKIYYNSDRSWFRVFIRNNLAKAYPTAQILCEKYSQAWEEAQMEWTIRSYFTSDSGSVTNNLVR